MACTMKELVSGIKRITMRNLGSYVIATGVTEWARSTNQNVHFTSSELAHLRSGTYYKEKEVALTENGGNGSHQNTNFPSLQLLKPPCFPSLCLWRADSSSLSTIPLWPSFLQVAENLPHQLPSTLSGTVGPSFTTDFFPCCSNTAIPLQLLFP